MFSVDIKIRKEDLTPKMVFFIWNISKYFQSQTIMDAKLCSHLKSYCQRINCDIENVLTYTVLLKKKKNKQVSKSFVDILIKE